MKFQINDQITYDGFYKERKTTTDVLENMFDAVIANSKFLPTTNKELFFSTLANNLKANMTLRPLQFKHDFETTFQQYKKRILSGKFHTITKSIRQTCQELGIKNVNQDIQRFINES